MIINFLLAVLQHRISIPIRFLKCPKLERLDFWPCFRLWGPGHRYMWSLIPTFFACLGFTENANMFLGISSTKKYFEVPQVRDSMSGACFPDWGPGRRFPWRPRRRLCSATAPQPRRGRCAPQGAAACRLRRFARKPVWPLWASSGTMAQRPMRRGWRTEVVGRWALHPFNRQRNDEYFGLNSFKLCKAKYMHTQSQTDRTNFMAFCFQQITFNETLSIINSLIVCLQKLERLWKTMSSSKSNS